MHVFGKRLRELRKNKNMTQQELGDLVGVTKVSICCYENGSRTPTLETLVDLCDVLNVRVTELIATDYFVVAEEDETKTLNIARDELEMLKVMRTFPRLYERVLEDPKRMLSYLEQQIR